MKIFSYLILSSSFLLAFNTSNGQKDKNPRVLEINSREKGDTLRLSDLCSEIKYLPLNPAENISISKSHKIKVVKDFLLVLEYHELKRFRVFNIRNGKKLFEISWDGGLGLLGMSHPKAFHLDVDDGRVEIFDELKNAFFFYDLNGALLKSTKVDFFVTDFTKNERNDYFIYTGGAVGNGKEKNIDGTLLITDSAFNIKRSFFEGSSRLEKLFFNSPKNFAWSNGSLYFMRCPDSHLYKVDEYGPSPTFSLDFMEKNIPEDLKQNHWAMKLSDWINVIKANGYYMGISNYFGNDNFHLMRFISIRERAKYYVKVDKVNDTYAYYNEDNFVNDLDGGLFGQIIHLDNDYLVTMIHLEELRDHRRNHPELNRGQLHDILDRTSGYDNAILMFGKLKKK